MNNSEYRISCLVNYSAIIDPLAIQFNHYDIKLFSVIEKYVNGLIIEIKFNTTTDLIKVSKEKGISSIRKILNELFPEINKNLLRLKYIQSHVLISSISMLDVTEVFFQLVGDDDSTLRWEKPFIIEPFPPLQDTYMQSIDEVFIRDYINAMTDYFKYDIDECIRKSITSLENYYDLIKIKGDNPNVVFKKGSFMAKTQELLSLEETFIMPKQIRGVAYRTIWLVYMIRNKITHDKYRLECNERWICNRIIQALYNLYNNRLNSGNISKLMRYLEMQFTLIDYAISENEYLHNFTMEFSDQEFVSICERFTIKLDNRIMSGLY